MCKHIVAQTRVFLNNAKQKLNKQKQQTAYHKVWHCSSSECRLQPERTQQHMPANYCIQLLGWKHGSYQKHSLCSNCQVIEWDGTLQRHWMNENERHV